MLPDEEELQKFLQENRSTKDIRLQWIDFSGILRARFVPIARCLQIAQGKEEYLIPQVSMIIPVSTAPKCFPTSNEIETWVLRPDWTSLRCCGFRPSHASVMCFVEHKEAEEKYNKCPRMLLTRELDRLERLWGVKMLAGFEIEVMLLDQNFAPPINQLDRLNSYQTTAGLRGQTLEAVEEILDCLKESSITIHHFHTETHDQIEFSLSPESPLNAIDSLILAQETIRTVFIRHYIKATMTPKPLINGPTNGIHLHLSVDKLAPPHTDNFLAGILTHIKSLCALGMANFDGYVRTTKDSAGAWIGFGTENRDLPVRKINDQHCQSVPVYRGGFTGWLEWVHPEHGFDLEGLSLDERMPTSLQEALESLKADEMMKTLIPGRLLDAYIAVKEKEVEVFQKMSDDQRRLRFLEYF
ncbi:hypothetical protein UA08_04893 [Talaromyces atroroseus]|uniref:GS catalytic domain-containing protein n=1 Tax=Talaromyces atroroseus TaxID=1441469 RepID=A0A225AWL8_TALAT|nr:hypothetical protein UA08_04893 [Talaromyces atroroseus]OKL60009.1 hypothetical protein UA08_04893 [Talaromyces atroroseus]